MMKRILPALFALVCAASASAAPFTNGSFDIGAPGPLEPVNCYQFDVTGNTIPGWTVSVGSVDWIGPCIWPSHNGTHSLDLLGSGKIGGVQQTFDTIPGTTYLVSFQLSGNPGAVPGSPPISSMRLPRRGPACGRS